MKPPSPPFGNTLYSRAVAVLGERNFLLAPVALIMSANGTMEAFRESEVLWLSPANNPLAGFQKNCPGSCIGEQIIDRIPPRLPEGINLRPP